MSIALGVDVGITGGLAAVSDKFVTATLMPITAGVAKGTKAKINIKEVIVWFKEQLDRYARESDLRLYGPPKIGIEIQGAMPGQGVVSMLRLGESYGLLQGMAIALNWSTYLVRPKAWKNDILAGTKKDKGAAIQLVLNRFSDIDMNIGKRKIIYSDGMADAVCIALHTAKLGHI